ncbi:hypothetical protein [Klebsiella pneumoniae]|uniref:hypothetical protein n=1 Tax=Klebsiella pneumoniae TaxID=573 RepID=UPI000F6895D3|nr:hypothetical protein [Klebsiella pneumoniae]MCC4979413.1 hypothetical protein [Klebsiella pneumoniae]RRZ78504.1 hypothetical protein EGK26_09785 [Klebsiella pneumoniae]RSA12607.1 hypothetical protein EGK07_06545 [Klebsiella pneumoniae]
MRLSIETISAIVTLGLIPVIKFFMKWNQANKEKAHKQAIAEAVADALKEKKDDDKPRSCTRSQ